MRLHHVRLQKQRPIRTQGDFWINAFCRLDGVQAEVTVDLAENLTRDGLCHVQSNASILPKAKWDVGVAGPIRFGRVSVWVKGVWVRPIRGVPVDQIG